MNVANVVQTAGAGPKVYNSAQAMDRQETRLILGRRVLIVEDETLVAWHLESVLQQLGYEVCDIVSNGVDAIEAAKIIEPDIVFMDVNLGGGIDGIEAAEQIVQRRETPIIFVTAYADDQTTLKRIKSMRGPRIVVGKPATPDAIHAAVQRLAV